MGPLEWESRGQALPVALDLVLSGVGGQKGWPDTRNVLQCPDEPPSCFIFLCFGELDKLSWGVGWQIVTYHLSSLNCTRTRSSSCTSLPC